MWSQLQFFQILMLEVFQSFWKGNLNLNYNNVHCVLNEQNVNIVVLNN